MAGKLIALESTNQQLLDKTAKYLALKLQSEGHVVEVMAFPQRKQSSSHFVESHQKGEYGEVNPYAASMFYILDRYDASPQIKQFLDQDVIVICNTYRGSTLAKLGAGISDAAIRKGFYIWADSLESGTFEVPRPDIAIVLSEELPTLYELCELFPKDYIYAVDPTKIRNMLNRLVPPAPSTNRRAPGYKLSWIEALTIAGKGLPFDFESVKSYANLPKESHAHKLYAAGLRELEVLKDTVTAKLPEELAKLAESFVTPLGLQGKTMVEPYQTRAYKNRKLRTQIIEKFEQTYGESSPTAKLMQANPRNELDALAAIILPKTELGIADIQKSLSNISYAKKTELFKAYLAGVDNQPSEYPLSAVHLSYAVSSSYFSILQLVQLSPQIRFIFQQPTPRWGYHISDVFSAAQNEIENCFISSLKLFGQLEAAKEFSAAQNIVLAGHFVQCVLDFDGATARLIVRASYNDFASDLCKDLSILITEQYPLLADIA